MFDSSNTVSSTEPETAGLIQTTKKILNIYSQGLSPWIKLEPSFVCNVLPKGPILLPQEIEKLKLGLRKKTQSIIWCEACLLFLVQEIMGIIG